MRIIRYKVDEGRLQKAREYLIASKLAEAINKQDGEFERKKKQIPGYIDDAINYIHAVIGLADDESNGVQMTGKSLLMTGMQLQSSRLDGEHCRQDSLRATTPFPTEGMKLFLMARSLK